MPVSTHSSPGNSLGKQQHRVVVEVDGFSGDGTNRGGAAYFDLSMNTPTRGQLNSAPTCQMPSIAYDQKKTEVKSKPEPRAAVQPKAKSPTPPPPPVAVAKVESPRRSKTPESSKSSRKSSPLSDVPIPAPIESIKAATPPPPKSVTPTPSGAGPELKKGLKDETFEAEAYVMLEVEFDGVDRVLWSLNNGPLPESTVVRETENGAKIRIRSFAPTDAGSYKATGFNKSGETSSTCHLYYGEKEKTPTPPEPLEPEPKEVAVSDLSNVDYCEGDKLTLQVAVTSDSPFTSSWLCLDAESDKPSAFMHDEQNLTWIEQTDSMSRLILDDVAEEDT